MENIRNANTPNIDRVLSQSGDLQESRTGKLDVPSKRCVQLNCERIFRRYKCASIINHFCIIALVHCAT